MEYYDDATGPARRNRMMCVQNKQDLLFLAKEIYSLKTRSASLSERLQNEINLVNNLKLRFKFTEQILMYAGIQHRLPKPWNKRARR